MPDSIPPFLYMMQEMTSEEIDSYAMNIQDLQLERDTFITVMSKRKSGKSVLIASLIHYYMSQAPENKRCQFAYLFSATAKINQQTNHAYNFFDKKAIFSPQPEVINNFIQRLTQSQIQTNMKYHILLVFDDIVVTHRYEVLEWLATAGRHHSITVILSSQISNTAVSPVIRSNVDYIFWRKLGKSAIQNNIFPFMDIGEFANYEELNRFTLENTSDYRFICYNNNTDDSKSKIRIVKAYPIPENYRYTVHVPTDTERKQRKHSSVVIRW